MYSFIPCESDVCVLQTDASSRGIGAVSVCKKNTCGFLLKEFEGGRDLLLSYRAVISGHCLGHQNVGVSLIGNSLG